MVEALIEAVGPWWFPLAVLVLVLGVGRLARLITHDTFPPAAAVRSWWAKVTEPKHAGWTVLLFCFWCITPWLMLVAGAWFTLTFTHPVWAYTWWIFWGWLALAYVASMIVARDEPQEPAS